MSSAVYALCAATSLFCAVLLTRNYRARRDRVLLWLGLCFWGLALNNVLLYMNLVVFPNIDLTMAARLATLVGIVLLNVGMIWHTT